VGMQRIAFQAFVALGVVLLACIIMHHQPAMPTHGDKRVESSEAQWKVGLVNADKAPQLSSCPTRSQPLVSLCNDAIHQMPP
jgi:hypothetical protein